MLQPQTLRSTRGVGGERPSHPVSRCGSVPRFQQRRCRLKSFFRFKNEDLKTDVFPYAPLSQAPPPPRVRSGDLSLAPRAGVSAPQSLERYESEGRQRETPRKPPPAPPVGLAAAPVPQPPPAPR